MRNHAFRTTTALFAALFVPLAAPAGAGPSAETLDEGTLSFRVAGMNCEGCEGRVKKALEKVEGVGNVEITFATESGTLELEKAISAVLLREALLAESLELLLGDQTKVEPLGDDERTGLDIVNVEGGGSFDLSSLLAPGKVTIIDFYAAWCAPCRVLTPKLERLVLTTENVALRGIDIIGWESTAAKQAGELFGLGALPFVVVFDTDGGRLGTVQGLRYEEIEALVFAGLGEERAAADASDDR